MESWYFETLGGLQFSCDSYSLDAQVGEKTSALLALLALAPGRTRPREEVVDLLWPEVDFEEARNRFRQILLRLRKQLEPEGVAPGSVLIANRSQIGLAAGHTSDVARFEQALRNAAVASDASTRILHLRAALTLYKGEFAPGLYLDTLLTERQRLAQLAEGAREKLTPLELSQSPPLSPLALASIRTENRFFGRESEKDNLRLLLQDYRLVTLLGPGGTGKTRLAQEFHTQTKGSHFISLSSLRNAASIPDALVAALELPDSTGTALTRLQAAFASKPILLVLDNVEQLIASGGAEAIATLLESVPTVRLLTTSRVRLHLPQECVCTLAPLAVPLLGGTPERLLEFPAVALFADRARLARSDFALTDDNAEPVAELCRRLDGLPLAIELAAARSAVLTPEQILERLSRRFDLLADRRKDREERHTSLRAALDWGWSLLAPDVQRFFTGLCVFRGSFSLEAAEAITGEFLAVDYLQNLADASFLLVEQGRFRLLETLREYGLEKLGKDESATWVRAHTDFFLARATEWRPWFEGEDAALAMGYFKQEQDNFTAALDRMFISDPERAIQLCVKLTAFWYYSYGHRLAIGYFHQALAAAEQLKIAGEVLARLHSALGNAYEALSEYVLARTYHQKRYAYDCVQLEQHEAAGDDEKALLPLKLRVSLGLHNLGNLFYHEKNLDAAQQYFHQACLINQSIGNDAFWARNLHGLYSVCIQRGLLTNDSDERVIFFELALAYAEEGTTICRRVPQGYHLLYLLHAQVYVLPLLDQWERALPLLDEGFALACEREQWLFVAGFLIGYYHRALQEQLWEDAAQLQGAVDGLSQRHEVAAQENDQHLYPVVSLPKLLGQERYELLYGAGFHASLDSLKTLVARQHQATKRQQQIG